MTFKDVVSNTQYGDILRELESTPEQIYYVNPDSPKLTEQLKSLIGIPLIGNEMWNKNDKALSIRRKDNQPFTSEFGYTIPFLITSRDNLKTQREVNLDMI